MSMSSLVFMIVVILCALYGGLLVTTTIEYFKNQRYFWSGVFFHEPCVFRNEFR